MYHIQTAVSILVDTIHTKRAPHLRIPGSLFYVLYICMYEQLCVLLLLTADCCATYVCCLLLKLQFGADILQACSLQAFLCCCSRRAAQWHLPGLPVRTKRAPARAKAAVCCACPPPTPPLLLVQRPAQQLSSSMCLRAFCLRLARPAIRDKNRHRLI